MLNFRRLFLFTIMLLLLWGAYLLPAQATVPLNDQFKATRTCEAFQSLRKRTNPGKIQVTPGQTYPVTAKNKPDETFYYLKIEDADPMSRWVSTMCGDLMGRASGGENGSGGQGEEGGPLSVVNVLAISWQPAFCETHQDKTECETQTEDRFDATNFTLHGLWPKPTYCNVSSRIEELDRDGKWEQLPPITLSDDLMDELSLKMPGVASDLHLHEWYKHGTCYSETPEEYYRESLALLDQINASDVRALFVSNIGENIRSGEIAEEFDDAFGNDAGKKVAVSCDRDNGPTNRNMIVELKLNIKGDIETGTLMADLFKAGKPVGLGCPSGQVDPVGFD